MARTPLGQKTTQLLRLALAHERGQLTWSMIHDLLAKPGAKSLSRRDFLKWSGLGLIGANCLLGEATWRRTTRAFASAAEQPLATGQVAIVGGGTAGLTAAYRLMQANVACTVYEASGRFGGRMYTEEAFNQDGMFCERGGELIDSNHQDLHALCAELGLGIQDLVLDDELVGDLFYFGGKVRTEADIVAAFGPLAEVLVRDQAAVTIDGRLCAPTYGSTLAQNPVVQRLDQTSLADYLSAVDCDQWLKDLLNIAYLGMMGAECAEQSALNLVTLIGADTSAGFKMYGLSDECKRIRGGNEQLPRALTGALQGKVPLLLQHKLLAIKDMGTGLRLIFDQQGQTVEVNADRVLIAMPLTTLRQVDMSGLNLSPQKRKAINEWGYGTNSKFMMGFSNRPWRSGPQKASGSVYSDISSQCFWDTSVLQAGNSGIITNFLSGRAGATIAPGQQQTALRDLESIFPGTAAAFDGNKLLQHWPSHPFTLGSYTSVRPGQYTTIYGAPGEPELGGRLLLAGEHCSTRYSGYMNGAVQSGNIAAQFLLRG